MQKSSHEPVQHWPAPSPGWYPLKWLVGLFSLALRSGSELTHLVGQMHRTYSDAPPIINMPPFSQTPEPHGNRSIPKIYALIRLLLEQSADKLHQAVAHLPSTDHQPEALRRVHSGMNGVFGDKLQEWKHPLALSMTLVNEQGVPVTLADLQAHNARGVLLFVHGLCLSEVDWQTYENRRFVAELQQQGIGVAWVRYNSGLPIWENGSALAQFLADHWQPEGHQVLHLIGHSMGGLIIRSALHHAEHVHASEWLNAVENVAYIATPHAGAPLEKIGNFANSLLGVSPYSKPLMALGNIRSRGIRSLRHGNIVAPVDESEQQAPVPFNARVRHFLLAARMGDDPAKRWLGDGLVPVASAMGEGHFPSQHDNIQRVFLDQVGHLSLLGDARLYDALRQWLALSADQH